MASRCNGLVLGLALILSNCAHAGDSALAPTPVTLLGRPATTTPSVLHDFTGAPDGEGPVGTVAVHGNVLFGVTSAGGTHGAGIVFGVTTAGAETILHSFGSVRQDGRHPSGGLSVAGRTLYGTTLYGGSNGSGTLFSIAADGTGYRVLHRFGQAADGTSPSAPPIVVDGTIFGTTQRGGACERGTVFRIAESGAQERVVHSFGCDATDGSVPIASLVNVGGTLYGTTANGGSRGGGTVFAIASDGTERIIHNFGGKDGLYPAAGMLFAGGYLYGTTQYGGAYGGGTVFELRTSGSARVVHSFQGGVADGAFPLGELALADGALYGTTSNGGPSQVGTLFRIGLTGSREVVLYDFQGGFYTDPAYPLGGLTLANTTLYGTTNAGGGRPAVGTLFSIPVQ